jgi:hypothetical protein
LVKKFGHPAGIDPSRRVGHGIGIHSLRKATLNAAFRNGVTMHETREFAGHGDIRTTEFYLIRREEDAEVAPRRIRIRRTGLQGQRAPRRLSQAFSPPNGLAANGTDGYDAWVRLLSPLPPPGRAVPA